MQEKIVRNLEIHRKKIKGMTYRALDDSLGELYNSSKAEVFNNAIAIDRRKDKVKTITAKGK